MFMLVGCGALLGGVVAAQDDVADVPSERIKLGAGQEYFLIGDPKAKVDAPRPLLLVLPGGDGGQDFNPFVRRIYKHSLSTDFLLAELIAVASDDPQQIVWPTASLQHPKQPFTTEAFMAAVVRDVGKRAKIDPKRVYALGWSSSGPALYAAAATKGCPVQGFFPAMSVFRTTDLPMPALAKSKRFYLLHSREDQVCPFRMAEQAKETLGKLGAPIMLVEYDGGHGWQGDVFGNIKAGVEWLEKK
jgi:predicted esterase